MATRNPQRSVLVALVVLYVLAAVAYVLLAGDLASAAGMPEAEMPDVPRWVLALANGGIVLVVYAPAGLVGLWLARKAGLPGVFRRDGGLKYWLWLPMALGLVAGGLLVGIDALSQRYLGVEAFSHPPFPVSILASFTAGVGEEIVFRLLLMSFWVLVFKWLLNRLSPEASTRTWSLWLANLIAALAFGAAHMGVVMAMLGASSPAGIPPITLVQMFLLNGIIGLLAGWAFARDGLVAAAGVHFWTDIVWHVLYGLVG